MPDTQTIYVTLDLRRGLWISEAIGATVLCSYQSDLLKGMKEKTDLWCFEEEFPEADLPRSTFLLLSRALTLNHLRDLNKDLSFIVFKPASKIRRFTDKEDWQLLASPIEVCRQLEDKVEFYELALKHDLRIPEGDSLLWNPDELEQYHERFGAKLIVQGRMGHAGSCTYLIEQGDHGLNITDGTRVKVSRFVEGATYTVNGFVGPSGKLAFGPLWQQLMHVHDWNAYDMGTVGVSPVQDFDPAALEQMKDELQKLSALFQELNYTGFFGLDLIWDGEAWYLIEVNPRLTATISLQCLEDIIAERVPLLKYQAEGSEPEEHRFDFLDSKAQYGQIIFRNSSERSWKTPKTLKSGIYHQSEAGDWQLKNRSADARELEEGEVLLLLSRMPNTSVDAGSDFASIQFLGSALDDEGKMNDRFRDFYERVVMGYLVRPKDFWTDRFVKVMDEQVFLWRQPKEAYLGQDPTSAKLDKHRQAEVRPGEVLKLLGEVEGWYLVEKVDGARGWLSKVRRRIRSENEEEAQTSLLNLTPASQSQFVMPGKASMNAKSFLEHWQGCPYLYGGTTEQGIDCSAFVQRYFWEVLGIQLPKHSQDQRAACSIKVDESELEDDDLVFLHSIAKGIPHVGIMRGGELWHSSLESGVVRQSLGQVRQKYEIEEYRRF